MTPWKPKERELTLEEAIAAAREQVAHLWVGSAPLLSALPKAGHPNGVIVPLDRAFLERHWLVLAACLSDESTPTLSARVSWGLTLWERYRRYGFSLLWVVEAIPSDTKFHTDRGVRSDRVASALLGSTIGSEQGAARLSAQGGVASVAHPIAVYDESAQIAQALEWAVPPSALTGSAWSWIVRGGKLHSTHADATGIDQIEAYIQSTLRESDPGLPLPRPIAAPKASA